MGTAPPTGLAPATSGLTGRRYHWLSYGGIVRALGLEPSLVRGKSPVPYLSGVTRIVGREGIEPPVSDDGWSTASCAPWRDRPMSRPGGPGPDDDVSAVVKVLVARLVAGRVEAGSEGVEPPVVGVGDRDTAMARARVWSARMTLCAWFREALQTRQGASELPAHDGAAGIGRLPSSRLILLIEVVAGCARERADARQGSTLEHWFGGVDACHRNDDYPLLRVACQSVSAPMLMTRRARVDPARRARDRAGEGAAEGARLSPGTRRWQSRPGWVR